MQRTALAALAFSVAACSIDTQQSELGVYEAPSSGGGTGAGDDGPAVPSYFLTMQLRDFKRYEEADPTTNPGFDNLNSEKGAVAATLGADRKPVYRAPGNAQPTFGAEYFEQWYRDVPGTNYTVVFPLPMSLVEDGRYGYDSDRSGKPDTYQGVSRRVFFPLDDGDPFATPFGNQGAEHNQAFTAELHATFTARANSTLHVRSDDDLYVFINDQLVLDLGGTHAAQSADLMLDELGLVVGESYPFDLFYAERLGATGTFALETPLVLVPVVLQ